MGTNRSMQSLTNGSEEKLSVPPGFVSLTALTLKRKANGSEEATDNMAIERIDPLTYHAIKNFKTSLNQRPWILHNQFDRALQNCKFEETEVDMGRSLRSSLPKGVFRGCASCHDCVKVTARWHPKKSCLPELDDAPVFHPTDEEFKDPMVYVSKIRLRAENYGIGRIVPPSSWRPPCLLEDVKTWKNSTFNTHIQQIDGLKNMYVKRRLSRIVEKSENKRLKVLVSTDLESLNGSADLKQANCIAVSSDFESGPEHTLQSFKKYADDFKSQYFCKDDEVTDFDVNLIAAQKNQGPLIARLEGEYWRIIENPSEEIEVLYGTDLKSRLGSGFPIKGSQENKIEHSEYVEAAWNLHNVPKLSSSLLPFGCDSTSAILVPQLSVGMCFTSQCWRNEDHHLYSLCYMHLGYPKVWYGIPGRYCFKFIEVAKKLCPELSEHPSLIHELVYQLSPSMLKSEGIPVYRCVQNPREFIVIFPGAYHSEFDCGFNCSESVCFAPFDWLPHGLNTEELYSDSCRKSFISYDRLLIEAGIEAVNAQWETFAIRNDSLGNQLWKSVCGKDGLLTKALKSRVQLERIRRDHICNPSQSRVLDEADAATKRDCSICLCDLYLSAMCCSCSPNKYTCLRHAKQLCYCTSWADKIFLFRYGIAELDSLVEALEGNLRATHIWAKKKIRPIPDSCAVKDSLHQPDLGDRSPAATSMSPRPVSSEQDIVQHSDSGSEEMLTELLEEEYEKMMVEEAPVEKGDLASEPFRAGEIIPPILEQMDTAITPEGSGLRRKRRRMTTPPVVDSSIEVEEIGATCPPGSASHHLPSGPEEGSPPHLSEEYTATTNHFLDPSTDIGIRILGSVGSKTEVAHASRMSYYHLVREICSRHIAAHQEAKTFRGKDKKFSSELAKLRAALSAVTAAHEEEVAQLKAEIQQTRENLESEAEQARAGMRAAQADSATGWAEAARVKAELEASQKTAEECRAEFIRSAEFAKMVSGKLTRAVVLGFRGCKDQLKAHGFFPDDKDPDCLDARAVVRSVPEDFLQGP